MALNIKNIESLITRNVVDVLGSGSTQEIRYDRIINNGGIVSKIVITDISNLKNGIIKAGSTSYSIEFRKGTGDYNQKEKSSQAGQFLDHTLVLFVPKQRAAMELLRIQLQDKKVLIQITDINGDIHLMYRALLSIDYQTGRSRTDSNGYTITASSSSLLRTFEPTRITEAIIGEEGVTEGSQFGEGTTPLGNTTTLSAEDIYFTVVTAPIDYMPTASDNPDNIRNKIVVAPDKSKWAIDIYGNGIMLESAKAIEYIIGNGSSTYTLTPPESAINIDHTDVLFTRNQVPMTYSDNPTKSHEYKYDGSIYETAPQWPLNVGDTVEARFF